MLISLHVRNLALIEEEEVTFTDGLNILTGETGAGKSILIGSVNLALGAKADRNMIRTGAEQALVEMTFAPDNEAQLQKLRDMDIDTEEDGLILIKRKIMPGRSVCSVNGETVTSRQLREIAESMIDIYGQRENQKLLRREAQLETIDDFGGARIREQKDRVGGLYREWDRLRKAWESDDLDEASRKREADLLSYEVREIEEADLKEGEDAELESRYRILGNFRKLSEAGSTVESLIGQGTDAADAIDRAVRELSSMDGVDENLDRLAEELSQIDDMFSGFRRSLADYMDELYFDPEEYMALQDRLNLIHHLEDKYGGSIEAVGRAQKEKEERLAFLTDYEKQRERLRDQMDAGYAKLCSQCDVLSNLRREAAQEFEAKLTDALMELNFPHVHFEVVWDTDHRYIGANGCDRAAFYISMNPGEEARPLEQIASGGELSRIMLGMKTVFAGVEGVHTLIFDEIDAGISGQTAWMVAQKMGRLAGDHQILCITHLPQIASMEDSHFLIEKRTNEGRTQTHIERLSEEESDREVARLVGADLITDASLENAKEMKRMARKAKENPAV